MPLPVAAIATAAGLGLTAVGTATALAQIAQGKLTISREQGDRMRTPPKPKDGNYTATVLDIHIHNTIYPDINATLKIHWSGNAYGEIGGAYVQVEPGNSEFSFSELTLSFSLLKDLPNAGDDPRAWPMQWIYTGRLDPSGNGEFDIQGKFQIDAFGSYKSLEHVVTDRSLVSASFDVYEAIAIGTEIDNPPSALPADANVDGSPNTSASNTSTSSSDASTNSSSTDASTTSSSTDASTNAASTDSSSGSGTGSQASDANSGSSSDASTSSTSDASNGSSSDASNSSSSDAGTSSTSDAGSSTPATAGSSN